MELEFCLFCSLLPEGQLIETHKHASILVRAPLPLSLSRLDLLRTCNDRRCSYDRDERDGLFGVQLDSSSALVDGLTDMKVKRSVGHLLEL